MMWFRIIYALLTFASISPSCANPFKNDGINTTPGMTVLSNEIEENTCSSAISEQDNITLLCRKNVCKRTFKISTVDLLPYSLNREVEELLIRCCGECVNYTQANKFTSSLDFTTKVMQSSDFVFPVLGRASASRLYGFYFVPFMNARTPVYLSRRAEGRLMQFLVRLSPIVAVCLLLAIIAGFIAWFFESSNNEDFPKPFIPGVLEG